jgi:hypothetical protein
MIVKKGTPNAVIVLLLAGGFPVACQRGAATKASVASGAAAPQAGAAPARPGPARPKPECLECALEDSRRAAHKDQVVVSARYLGLKERWYDEHRTNRRCSRERDVMGVVRFALIGQNPWLGEFSAPPTRRDLAKMMEVNLPCPELSRPQYAKMYHYDPDDTERDGLGHAPVLRRGELYRLTFVRNVEDPNRPPNRPNEGRLVLTLVAVNPL